MPHYQPRRRWPRTPSSTWLEAQLNSIAILAGKKRRPQLSEAEILGHGRTEYRRGASSQRILSAFHDVVGAAGEIAFAQEFGLKVDKGLYYRGDSFDFKTPIGTIDVKTARRPISLLVKKGSRKCDIYVLAGYKEKTKTAKLIGWEWGKTVRKAEVCRVRKDGPENYSVPTSQLRPISELREMLDAETEE